MWHPIHARDAAKWTRDALEALWRGALERDSVGRRVELSDELTVFLREKQHGFVRFRGKKQVVRRTIPTNAFRLFDHPFEYWRNFCEAGAIRCYDGDFGFMLREFEIPFVFNPQTVGPTGLKRPQVCFANGGQAEFQWVTQWAWKLDPTWEDEVCDTAKTEGAGVQLILRPDKPARASFGGPHKISGWITKEHPRQPLWNEVLRFFNPVPDPKVHGSDIEDGMRLFLLHLRPEHDAKYYENYGKPRSQHSFHRQLELRLPLRQWLRDRARLSDERIAELLF